MSVCTEILKWGKRAGNYCHKKSDMKNGYCHKHTPYQLKEEIKKEEKKTNKLNEKILESIPSLPFDLSLLICQYSFSDLVLKNLDNFYQYILMKSCKIENGDIIIEKGNGEICVLLHYEKNVNLSNNLNIESELKKYVLKNKLPERHEFIYHIVCFSILGEIEFDKLIRRFILNLFSFGSYQIVFDIKNKESVKLYKTHAMTINMRKYIEKLPDIGSSDNKLISTGDMDFISNLISVIEDYQI